MFRNLLRKNGLVPRLSVFRARGAPTAEKSSIPSEPLEHQKGLIEIHNFISREASLRRFEMTHESHPTVSKMSTFVEFGMKSERIYFHRQA